MKMDMGGELTYFLTYLTYMLGISLIKSDIMKQKSP